MKIPTSGWKTVVYGAAIALTAVFSSPDVQVFISNNIPAIGGVVGLGVVILRTITSSPIFKSKV